MVAELTKFWRVGFTMTERAGSEIVYGIVESDLGFVLVGRDDVGVCAVFLGDSEEELEVEVQRRFRGVAVTRSEVELARDAKEVLSLVSSPSSTFEKTISMHGTAFQRTVWNELQKIPAGAPVSYKELASRIGRPTAVRAVAGACAANPLALIVPCHRVIAANGDLTGYRWGIERKRELLSRE